MNVIALDTASPSPAVTVLRDGSLFEQRLASDRRASEDLLPALERCLADAGLALASCERIVVCSGPGSFTGARVGLATAWGLSRALDVPAEAVSTLEAMAEAARDVGSSPVLVALDAGRGEVVLGEYVLGGSRAEAACETRRAPLEEARRLAGERELYALPADLLPEARPLPITPSAAIALAAARAPRAVSGPPGAVYSRPSAAEEKRGAP